MKKFALALAAVVGLAFVVPATAPAEAGMRGHDRGHHYGWRHNRGHHYGWRNHHRGHHNKVVFMRKRSHHM